MRNNTKLKTLLLKYTVAFDMDADGQFILHLIDKDTRHSHRFEASSYSKVLSNAYSFLLKSLKNM